MYKIYLLNFSYFLDQEFEKIEDAVATGRRNGFEFAIYKDKTIIGNCRGPSLRWHIVNSKYSDQAGLKAG